MNTVLSVRQDQDIDKDDQELIMKLSEMYQQQLERATTEGVQQGVQQGIHQGIQQGSNIERRAMIESIMQVRFGEIDPQLATIIDPLIAMTREEFTPLLLQLSREELLARFG